MSSIRFVRSLEFPIRHDVYPHVAATELTAADLLPMLRDQYGASKQLEPALDLTTHLQGL